MKTRQINIRVTEGDYKQLEAQAQRLRLSVPRFVLFVLAKHVLGNNVLGGDRDEASGSSHADASSILATSVNN